MLKNFWNITTTMEDLATNYALETLQRRIQAFHPDWDFLVRRKMYEQTQIMFVPKGENIECGYSTTAIPVKGQTVEQASLAAMLDLYEQLVVDKAKNNPDWTDLNKVTTPTKK